MVMLAEKLPFIKVETKEQHNMSLNNHSLLQPGHHYLSFVKPCPASYIHDCIPDEHRHNSIDLLDDLKTKIVNHINNDKKESPKKKVCFADSLGLELVQIRLMTAGRDTPPIIDPKVFESLNLTKSKLDLPTLTLGFKQPVSDYSRFTQCLAKNHVSLESVSLSDNMLVGTIRVKNLAYHKKVSVRITYDCWNTTEEVPAHYINNGLINGQGHQMPSSVDTFSFNHEFPIHKLRQNYGVEFAVCFQCEGQEFWDNNDNTNYVISVKNCHTSNAAHNTNSITDYSRLPYQNTNWTEYAIWRGLETDYQPYW